jgi:glutamyl/glutaminyl-tRNA synthetase
MQKLDDITYLTFVKKFISFDTSVFNDKLDDVLLLFKSQISYAKQLDQLVTSTFLSNKHNRNIDIKLISALTEEINNTSVLTYEVASQIIKNIQVKTQLKGKDLYMPLRLLLTGNEHGPELNKIISILGKEKILKLLA